MLENDRYNIDVELSISTGRLQYLESNSTTISHQITNFLVSGSMLFLTFILIREWLPVAESIFEGVIIIILIGITLLPIAGQLFNNKLRTVTVNPDVNWPNLVERYFQENEIPVLYKTNRLICAQKDGNLTTAGRAWVVIFDHENIFLNTQTLNRHNWPSTFNYLSNQRHISELRKFIQKKGMLK